MLEHANRDDAVEFLTLHRPVVLQFEADAIGKAAFLRPFAGDLQLLFAQRDAGEIDARRRFRDIHAHPAPAGADFQHPLVRLKQQLGRDMALLGNLRLLQADAGRIVIGTGILPVLVQEQLEQLFREIVVMGDVALVVVDGKAALELLQGNAADQKGCHRDVEDFVGGVLFHHGQEIVDVAVFHE
jgi:hypothetical protein